MKGMMILLNIPDGKVYYSFTDVAKDIGIKPFSRKTTDQTKLESQQKRFLGTCPYCHQLMKYIPNTNVVVCSNENCKGKKKEFTNRDGETVVKYEPYSKVLYGKSAVIADTLFNE